MTPNELSGLSFAELHDRLQARERQPESTERIDIDEALRYLVSLPDGEHTAESVGALLHLAINFRYASQPANELKAASHAARLAVALEDRSSLCAARGIEGVALDYLGNVAEAAVALAESWELAREIADAKREIHAIGNFGNLCAGIGQWAAAMHYFERARELAEENGYTDLEFQSRSNLAMCSVNLREPASGLLALSEFGAGAPRTRQDMAACSTAYVALARLQLLIGNVKAARLHAERSARMARTGRLERAARTAEAVLGLIDVSSGMVDRGLAAVEGALATVRRVDETEVPDHLGICIDAYETAGCADRALECLQELLDWKKKSIDAQVSPLQYEGLTEPIQFQSNLALRDGELLAKAQALQSGVKDRIRRLVETAINAEMASGHDLYRTFRVAKLARYLAAAVGWHEERIASLALAAQLCNIGMIAIPTRILQKQGRLSNGEQSVLHEHTRYGAELLRRTRLRALDVASIVAEQHREHYDGSGYPNGLAGNAVSEEARIVAICDAFDAMTHPRPWRTETLSIQTAMEEVKRCAGGQFDPHLVSAFIESFPRQFADDAGFDAFLAEGAAELEYVRARSRMEALIGDRGDSHAGS